MAELPPEATDPECRIIFEYWRGKAPAGRLPGRQHLDPCEIPPDLLPWVMLIDVTAEPQGRRFRYRLIGTQITELFGLDPTGRFMDDVLTAEQQSLVFGALNFVCDEKQPHHLLSQVAVGNRDYITAKRLSLPLAGDGDTVDMVLVVFVPVAVPTAHPMR